ncbi:MAG: type I-E CRISPR-associated protein Cse1/CasA [Candidatus Micrarchaeota archaeon]
MNDSPDNYNLLDKEWIPVLWRDGKTGRVNIKEALTQAGLIRQIAASNPMDRMAIIRFLLALLYWCRGNPPNKESATSCDSFPAEWFSKLEENQDCFKLLGEGKRFYQCTVSHGEKSADKLSANYLIQEIPTGTNISHFRHSTDGVDGLCLACCAIGLLRLPLFATSGGRGKPPGINAKPPFYAMPIGVSLAETLRLSWIQISNLGLPAWERPDLQLPRTSEVPLLRGLTWLPRRVWLDDPKESDRACISCGRRDRLVLQCIFAGIGSTRTDEGGSGRMWHDPHVVYVRTSKGDVTPLYAMDALAASDAASGQWAAIMAAVAQEVADTERNTWVVAFATVKNDKYLEAMEHLVPSPRAQHDTKEFIAKIETWRKERTDLVRMVRSAKEKESTRKHTELLPLVAAIRPHVEQRVSAKARDLLPGGHDAWERAAHEYGAMMGVIAKSLSPGFTTAALERRRQIASRSPNMGPRAAQASKTRPQKGGQQ